jgi:hypothetical protein
MIKVESIKSKSFDNSQLADAWSWKALSIFLSVLPQHLCRPFLAGRQALSILRH